MINFFALVVSTIKDIFLKLSKDTVFLTVISGVLVYIFSQLYMEKIMNPSKEYKTLRQKIICSISMYCMYYLNPYDLLNVEKNIRDKSEYEYASTEMRRIGCELAGYIGTMCKLNVIKKKKLNKVLDALIGISNSFYIVSYGENIIGQNREFERTIKRILRFK